MNGAIISSTTRHARSRLRFLFAVLAALALVLTACGGDDDDTGGEGDGETTEEMTDDEMTDGEGDGEGDGEASGDSELLAQAQEQGYLEVGIANEVPYGYEDEDGNVTGEAPEVARRVLEELGIPEIRGTVVDFGNLISGLQAGQFDMIAAGMYITPDRADQILFSDPDYCVGESLAVPAGNPMDLSDFQSVIDTGATIGVLSGAVDEDYVDWAGIPEDQIELFADVNAQYDALEAGRVDAVSGTTLTVQTQAESRDAIEAAPSFFVQDENGEEVLGCGGFGFRPENQAFRDMFNEALNSLQDEGELLPIITGFGFNEDDVRRAQELTVEDLASE